MPTVERKAVLHWMRIAVTALSLTACVLLVALWVRSAGREDLVWGPILRSGQVLIGSTQGTAVVAVLQGRNNPLWTHVTSTIQWDGIDHVLFPNARALGFSFRWDRNFRIVAPYWFLTSLAALSAAAPWIFRRFSLRTLLIATTLVAVGLGMIVALW